MDLETSHLIAAANGFGRSHYDPQLSGNADVQVKMGWRTWLPSKEATTTFKSVVGSGFFAMPFALQQAGLVGGLLVVAMVWFFTVWTTKQLVFSAMTYLSYQPAVKEGEEISYLDLGRAAFSTGNLWWISLILFLSQYIAVCAYLVFLESMVTPLLSSWVNGPEKDDYGFLDEIVMIVSVLIQILFAFAPNPSFLERVSNFGNAAFMLSVVFMVVHGLTYTPPNFAENTTAFKNIQGAFLCFGIASFTLSAHAECLSIFSTASPTAQDNYAWTVDKVVAVATVFYLGIAIFTYGCFGESTKQIVFENFTATEGYLGLLLQLAVCLMILCNYPLTLYPVHQVIESSLGLTGPCKSRITFAQLASRTILITSSALVAYATGDRFGYISTIGGAFVAILAFVLPPFIYIALHGGWAELSLIETVVNCLVIGLGCFGSVQSFFEGIAELSSHAAENVPEPLN